MSVVSALGHGGGSGTPAPAPARRARGGAYLLLAPGLLYLGLFFVVPVFALLVTSLYVPVPGGDVGQFQPAFEWQNYTRSLETYWPQLVRSFSYAAIATILAFCIGYPMAYTIAVKARGRPFLQAMLLVLVIAPFFTSFILRTVAWKQILADEGFVVAALKALAVIPPDGRLTATSVAVVAGLTYNFLPFMTLPIYANLERLDPRLIEAGADLYANGPTTFWRVTLPMSMPGVVSGTLLTFIPASGDFVNSVLLGNNSTTMIGQVIDSRFFKVSDYPTAAALSFVLMMAILVLVAAYIRRAGTEELL
ncbi:ABC transporter permease [Actinotalea ferrariae CF5-4]|uniref:ABC transporter permease n=1 Tax=Actinotalea ferrariae CF5-4 TaxID=948458 RepID=A0A021VT17_9CELL|nr:ABC transporter permease [Actinotalea ferrariae]EYR64296.1 ABC transporter permease [Actinotalea ferrariae CF5-4]